MSSRLNTHQYKVRRERFESATCLVVLGENNQKGENMAMNVICDIEDCKKKASERKVKLCSGYTEEEGSSDGRTVYKPFENPDISELDLCRKHFKDWCEATYNAFWKKVKT